MAPLPTRQNCYCSAASQVMEQHTIDCQTRYIQQIRRWLEDKEVISTTKYRDLRAKGEL